MRDRLIELIQDSVGGCAKNWAEIIADHLLANGVFVPPCKVGDTVYHIQRVFDDETLLTRLVVKNRKVDFVSATNSNYMIEADGFIFDKNDFGKTVFLTYEQAEKALAERSE